MTHKEFFTEAIKVAEAADRQDLVEFFESRIAALEKKSSSKKPTKVQEVNERFKTRIAEILRESDKPMTVTEIITQVPKFEDTPSTTPKVSALLKQMKEDGKVVRTEDKKKAYFALAE